MELALKLEKGSLAIQDFDLHIPEVIHKNIKSCTFLRNTEILPLSAENIVAVKKCGMDISES